MVSSLGNFTAREAKILSSSDCTPGALPYGTFFSVFSLLCRGTSLFLLLSECLPKDHFSLWGGLTKTSSSNTVPFCFQMLKKMDFPCVSPLSRKGKHLLSGSMKRKNGKSDFGQKVERSWNSNTTRDPSEMDKQGHVTKRVFCGN